MKADKDNLVDCGLVESSCCGKGGRVLFLPIANLRKSMARISISTIVDYYLDYDELWFDWRKNSRPPFAKKNKVNYKKAA